MFASFGAVMVSPKVGKNACYVEIKIRIVDL
jgi:hypothetical protein